MKTEKHSQNSWINLVWPKVSGIKSMFYFNNYESFLLLAWVWLQWSNKLNNSLFLQEKIHVLWRNLSGHRMAKRRGPLVMTGVTEGGETGVKISNLGCTVYAVRPSPWIFTPTVFTSTADTSRSFPRGVAGFEAQSNLSTLMGLHPRLSQPCVECEGWLHDAHPTQPVLCSLCGPKRWAQHKMLDSASLGLYQLQTQSVILRLNQSLTE